MLFPFDVLQSDVFQPIHRLLVDIASLVLLFIGLVRLILHDLRLLDLGRKRKGKGG